MKRSKISAFIWSFLAYVFLSGVIYAQSDAFERSEYNTLFERATEVLDRGLASDEALRSLRNTLVDARDRAAAAANRTPQALAALDAQIEALGPIPADAATEDSATAAKRAELRAAREALLAPTVLARTTSAEAEALISRLDVLVRVRQTEVLTQLGPTPLARASWISAARVFAGLNADLQREFNESLNGPNTRQVVLNRLPLTVFLFVLGLLLMVPRYWAVQRLPVDETLRKDGVTPQAERYWANRVLLASVLGFLLPVLGIWVISIALRGSGLVGLVGLPLVNALPAAGAFLILGHWMGLIFRKELLHIAPQDQQSLTGLDIDLRWIALLGSLAGLGLALGQLIEPASIAGRWDAAAKSVFRLPYMLLWSVSLALYWYVGRRMRSIRSLIIGEYIFARRCFDLSRAVALVAAIATPSLALIGYGDAAIFIARSTILSLGLLALYYVIYQIIQAYSHGDLSDQGQTQVEEGRGNSAALLRLSVGVVLALIAIPILAVIWGARGTDILNAWEVIESGFAIGNTRLSLSEILSFIIVFVFGYMLTRLFQGALRSNVLPNTRLDRGAQYALVAGTGYLGIFISALAAISTTGLDLSNLALLAGALSVGIGFGLQNIVSNFISGIILLIERPFKEGDWIEVQGVHGYVKNISVRSTEILTFDRSTVMVPNADLVTGRMTNFTHRNMVGRVVVPVGVAYGSDVDQVVDILSQIAREHPMVLLNPAPSVMFMGFGNNSLDFEVRAMVRDINWGLSVKSEMNHAILKRFTTEGIEIPFVQRDITIKNLDELKP